MRTRPIYLAQVTEALRQNKTFEGIKDSTPLSDMTNLPESEIVDPVHLIYEGTFKALGQMWFSSKHSTMPYYLGKMEHQNKINALLKNVKYPTDFPRLQREIQKFDIYQANEYKNFLLHVSLYIFENLLPKDYYDHLLIYVLFVRLLSKPAISVQDVANASLLINKFVSEFEHLYGKENMSFNLHCHLHLPRQVFKFGGLDKLNVFPLEGYFKICHSMFFGTHAIGEQILTNIAIKHQLIFLTNLTNYEIQYPILLSFYDRLMKNTFKNITCILAPKVQTLYDLEENEQVQLIQSLNTPNNVNFQITTGFKAKIGGLCEYPF